MTQRHLVFNILFSYFCQIIMSRFMVFLILLGIILLNCQETLGRRGRGRSRSKSRVQIGLPITGKYRDPESDQYYNNNNVCRLEFLFHFRAVFLITN